jgi:FKBP-type peptidyl-prolyl cis-trans isomerase FkpA
MKHLLSMLLVFTLFSCIKDNDIDITPKDFTVENEKEITDYIAKNNLIAQRTSTGLYYVINEPGEGAQPTPTSNVTVIYKGYFTNGTVFDPGKPEGVTYRLNQFIKGWIEGIPYFKTGGSGILLIPSHLGYGSFTDRGIPGGSVLVFDIKLISVNN